MPGQISRATGGARPPSTLHTVTVDSIARGWTCTFARAMPTRPSPATAISTAMTDADSSTIGSLVTDQAP